MGVHLQPVNLTSPAIGDQMRFDGTDWVNFTPEVRHVANASIDVQNMNLPGVAAVTDALSEGTWAFDAANNAYAYTGLPTYIVINVHVHQRIADNVNFQRPSPLLILERSTDAGANWAEVARSATGYIRDTIDHEESSNGLWHRDLTPVSGALYRLSKLRDTTNQGACTSTLGQFDLEAITKAVT